MSAPGFEAGLWNLVVVLSIFVIVGPPAAALAFMGLLAGWLGHLGSEEAAPFVALATVFGAVIAYVAAIGPAALVGCAFALWQTFVGRVRWPAAAVAGLASGSLVGAFGDAFERSQGAKSLLPLFLLTGLAGVLVPWALARSFVAAGGRREPVSARSPEARAALHPKETR
ncbi:MAG: hypothetical protein JWN93_3344 [Hyphomicrobiales bacterium]|nr:hypothetical protein [Hyphomicrobiales bacterium]